MSWRAEEFFSRLTNSHLWIRKHILRYLSICAVCFLIDISEIGLLICIGNDLGEISTIAVDILSQPNFFRLCGQGVNSAVSTSIHIFITLPKYLRCMKNCSNTNPDERRCCVRSTKNHPCSIHLQLLSSLLSQYLSLSLLVSCSPFSPARCRRHLPLAIRHSHTAIQLFTNISAVRLCYCMQTES